MQSSQIRGTLSVLCLAWLSVSSTSRADSAPPAAAPTSADVSVAACADAYDKGQEYRLAGRLLDAREQFSVCSNPRCPRAVFPDCRRWAEQVEAALVGILPEARNAAGQQIAGLSVSVDGVTLTAAQLRRPVSLEQGKHAVRFEAPGYEPVQVEVELRSGDRSVSVRAVMQRPALRAEPPPPKQLQPASSFPVAAVSIAGVGVLALVGAAYMGASAVNRYDALKSSCSPGCPPQESDTVHQRAVAADLLFTASAVAFAGAAWLYFGRSPDPASTSTALGVRASAGGAQVALRLDL